MISIGSYLQAGKPEQRSKSLERVTAMLLQGIALHSYNFDDAEYEDFQCSMRKLRDQIGKASDEDGLLLTAGAAIHVLDQHNKALEKSFEERNKENNHIVSMMTQALLGVVTGNAESVRSLAAIGKEFAQASRIDDLRALKDKLSLSLDKLCEETRRQQMVLALLRSDITRVASHPDIRAALEFCEVDPVTTLPNVESAAKSIVAAWDSGVEAYVVLFALDRVDSINSRYGFRAGDEILSVFSQHVLAALQPEDQLFRWRGPCFVGLLEKRQPESHVASEMNRLANCRVEHVIRVKERDVMLPISASWTMFSLRSSPNVDELLSRVADFLSSRSSMPRRER